VRFGGGIEEEREEVEGRGGDRGETVEQEDMEEMVEGQEEES